MRDGEIIPGKRIGDIELGISREALLDRIGYQYSELEVGFGSLIESENVKYWFGEDGKLRQIGVGEGFVEKFQDKIGIGSTLQDIQNCGEEFVDNEDISCTYGIKGIEGFCFELKDVESYEEEWDELTAPIEYMYVFAE